MNHYIFIMKEGANDEEAIEELVQAGVNGVYLIQDHASGEQILGGWLENKLNQEVFENIDSYKEAPATEIDWQDQWACFDPSFKDGLCHLELKSSGASEDLFLLPGAGFGNLSHPTTRLMLDFLEKYAPKMHIIDIGCGSGILTLAASLFNAKSCWGIDIDDAALQHAQENAAYNHLEEKVTFSKKLPFTCPQNSLLVLMNMIFSEQQEAFKQTIQLHPIKKKILTSGILLEERESYLEWTRTLDWNLLEEKEEEGWLAFAFSSS